MLVSYLMGMLGFLRKIRKSLIESGSVSRYVLYAVGEIALVVIGILIALQINNWNEWRKDRIKETKILEDLVENLELNANTLERQMEVGFKRDSLSSQIIISFLENKLPYHDSLENHFGYALNMSSDETVLSFVGYESMRNTGFDIVRDAELKKEIIHLFELTYDQLEDRSSRVGQSFGTVQGLIHERLMRKSGFRYAPFNYEGLFEDREFLSWLHTIFDNRGWVNASRSKSLMETERVLQLIRDELGE